MTEQYGAFVEENKKLLEEKKALEQEIKLLKAEIALYKKLSSKIVMLVNSREKFNDL